MARQTPPEDAVERGPKPYQFVSFVDRVVRQAVPGHEAIHPDLRTGTLAFRLRTLTPLFVSSGQPALGEDVGLPASRVVHAHYRIDGCLAIPASSLKGAVRSVAEAVSPSCLAVTRLGRRELPRAFAASCTRQRACPACILFGMGGSEAYLGQVRFEDARLQADGKTMVWRLPALYRPRPGTAPYRDRRGGYKGRKFYKHGKPLVLPEGGESEAIAPTMNLVGKVAFTNLSDEQLGLLFYAMGLDGSFRLKLGGGKPACLGSLQTIPESLALRNTRQSFLGDHDQVDAIWHLPAVISEVAAYIEKARQSGHVLRQQAQELEEALHYDHDTLPECPTGAY